MKAGLTVEQMKLLLSKGFSGEEMIAFAEMGQAKSKGALRTARWRDRRNGNVTNSVTSDGHSDASHPPIEDIIPPIPSNDGITRRPKTEKLAKPEGVTDGTWQDFLNHRNKKRAIVTAGVIATIATEAKNAGWTLEAALAEMVARGWQGFKAEFVRNQQAPAQAANDGDALLRAMRAKKHATAPP